MWLPIPDFISFFPSFNNRFINIFKFQFSAIASDTFNMIVSITLCVTSKFFWYMNHFRQNFNLTSDFW